MINNISNIFAELDERRRELGMSQAIVAWCSGVTLRTVQRVFSGDSKGVRLETICKICSALEVGFGVRAGLAANYVRRKQAKAKAEKLVAIAQGSAALEDQAVPWKTRAKIRKMIEDDLLAGTNISLWSHVWDDISANLQGKGE